MPTHMPVAPNTTVTAKADEAGTGDLGNWVVPTLADFGGEVNIASRSQATAG